MATKEEILAGLADIVHEVAQDVQTVQDVVDLIAAAQAK